MARAQKSLVRRVTSREDRSRPSVFHRLKTDESFVGHALFEPDPELDDNGGYFEYYVHNDQQAKRYVPCAGDNCPFCAANDNPGTRALTAWLFPDNEIKLFEINWSTVQALDDESDDEDGILGKMLRIKRMDDKGQYRVKVLSGPKAKPLTKAEQKKVLAELEEKFDLQGVVEKRLRAELDRMSAEDVLDDEDDDEDEENEEPDVPATKAKRTGKARARVEEDESDEEEDEDESEDEDENEEDEEDESEDEDEDEDTEEDEDENEDEEDQVLTGNFTVSRVLQDGEIIHFTNEDEDKYKMYAGEGLEIDLDEVTKGVEVKLSAVQDEEGDWIITEIDLAKKRATRKPRTRR